MGTSTRGRLGPWSSDSVRRCRGRAVRGGSGGAGRRRPARRADLADDGRRRGALPRGLGAPRRRDRLRAAVRRPGRHRLLAGDHRPGRRVGGRGTALTPALDGHRGAGGGPGGAGAGGGTWAATTSTDARMVLYAGLVVLLVLGILGRALARCPAAACSSACSPGSRTPAPRSRRARWPTRPSTLPPRRLCWCRALRAARVLALLRGAARIAVTAATAPVILLQTLVPAASASSSSPTRCGRGGGRSRSSAWPSARPGRWYCGADGSLEHLDGMGQEPMVGWGHDQR